MTIVSHLYRITNKLSGEYYIGKHNGWEQNGYWGSGYRIRNSIKKYGIENFKYEILCFGSVEYIYELEKKYVTPEMVDLDEKCLNLTIGGLGVNYHTKQSKQKLRKARAKQVFSKEDMEKRNKTISTLVWMNDSQRSYRIRPENVQVSINKGLVFGRLGAYITEKFKNKFKENATKQWQKVKETGHTGHLIKVN